MGSLTDRYVDATLRRLPARLRPDIEQELRVSIADAVDGRVDGGADRAAAERAVLAELGDPIRLAAGYADRPLHLVGPAHYFDYLRLLTTLLATVVPIVAATAGLVRVGDGSVTDVMGSALGAAVTAGVHIAVWTTVLFALIERVPALRWTSSRPWTPDDLPEPPSRRTKYGELVTVTVLLALFASLTLLSPVISTETDVHGEPVGPLSPWLWETGFVYVFIGLLVVALGLVYAKYYLRWSVPVAIAAALLDVACAVSLIWLVANDRLLNPAFIEAAGWSGDLVRTVEIALYALAAVTILHAVAEATTRTRRR
jgi:hypothetical protein